MITAAQAPLVHPSNSRYLADHIPGAEYAEIATTHLPMLERPKEGQALIEEFLTGTDRDARLSRATCPRSDFSGTAPRFQSWGKPCSRSPSIR
ncbi:hypothetical protein AB0D04_08420 [Streptomyces sp. NPDC048483]|uniref:alpha/beta fold hydrolase n=1 Tax=Streptomyces sp. NPDC048483 TaxID=3154927 RepID=UPI003449F54E